MCVSLAACGAENQPAPDANDTPAGNAADTIKTDSISETESLPVGIGGVYSCTVDGVDGYISVYSYEVYPDEMNDGCEIRTATVRTLFNNAPADFSVQAVAFPVAAGTLSALEDGAWITETEYGEDIIFEYDNAELYSLNENGVFSSELIVSYMVPQHYDEVAFAVTSADMYLPFEEADKSLVVSDGTRWFTMGGLDNGVLTYNGEALSIEESDADQSVMSVYGTPDSGNVQFEEEYVTDYEGTSAGAAVSKTLVLDYGTACTSATQSGITNEFESIVMTDCSDSSYTVAVRVKYSGVPANTPLRAGLWDCSFTELEVETQETAVSGSGTQEFVFHIDADSTVPPYTFTASVIVDGLPRDMTIHIDGNIQ